MVLQTILLMIWLLVLQYSDKALIIVSFDFVQNLEKMENVGSNATLKVEIHIMKFK